MKAAMLALLFLSAMSAEAVAEIGGRNGTTGFFKHGNDKRFKGSGCKKITDPAKAAKCRRDWLKRDR